MVDQAIASHIMSKIKVQTPQQAMMQKLQGQQQSISAVIMGDATSKKQAMGHPKTARTTIAMIPPVLSSL